MRCEIADAITFRKVVSELENSFCTVIFTVE